MKNTTKKLLAAVMTALLVAVAFVGVAAAPASNSVAISVNTTGLQNLWTNDTGYEKYWTLKGQDIEIPFNVTGTGDYKYLAGYLVTFDGNLTDISEAGGQADYKNASSVWNEGSLATNGKTIAKAVDANDVLNITSGNSTFKVAVTVNPTPAAGAPLDNGIIKMLGVNLTNLDGNFSTTKSNVTNLESYKDLPGAVGASLDTNKGFFSTNKEFVIAVRDYINNTKFTFPDYNTTITGVDTNPDTVYIYLEHEKGQSPAKEVNVTATLNYSFDKGYDTNAWKLDSGSNNFSITSPVDPAADNKKNLSNVLTIGSTVSLTGVDTKQDTLNLTINEKIPAAANTTKVTLNLSNWNTAYETNNNSATFDSYASTTKWSFVTNLTANYTIRAGPVNTSVSDDGWNTSVLFKNITVPKHENIQWTPNVTILGDTGTADYKINKLADVDGTKNLTSGQYFNVTTNNEKDGTKTLTIMLTGYRLGDANIDRNVDIVDSAVVGVTVVKGADQAAGKTFLPEENRIYADCGSQDPNGDIDVADIRAINNYLVGKDPWGTS